MTTVSSCMVLRPRQVKPLATLTAVPHPPVSAPPSSPACLAPPAKFGRRAQAVRDLHVEVSAGRLFEHPVRVSPAGYRSDTLSVVLDNLAAVAQALREQMQPADLMDLMFILAEATADVLRQRNQMH